MFEHSTNGFCIWFEKNCIVYLLNTNNLQNNIEFDFIWAFDFSMWTMDRHPMWKFVFEWLDRREVWQELLWNVSKSHVPNWCDCIILHWRCCERPQESRDVTFHLFKRELHFTIANAHIKPTIFNLPVMYRSTATPFSTELPAPAQTAYVLIWVSGEQFTPNETCTVLIPVWFLTRSMASFRVIGAISSQERPGPTSVISSMPVAGKMTFDGTSESALASQSVTPPRTESHVVCGEYNAIRFSRHKATTLSFQVLKCERIEELLILHQILTIYLCVIRFKPVKIGGW